MSSGFDFDEYLGRALNRYWLDYRDYRCLRPSRNKVVNSQIMGWIKLDHWRGREHFVGYLYFNCLYFIFSWVQCAGQTLFELEKLHENVFALARESNLGHHLRQWKMSFQLSYGGDNHYFGYLCFIYILFAKGTPPSETYPLETESDSQAKSEFRSQRADLHLTEFFS